MGAHLRSIRPPLCKRPYCGRNSTVELVNTFNAPCGSFCSKHGKQELAAMLKREQADWDRGVRNNGLVDDRGDGGR